MNHPIPLPSCSTSWPLGAFADEAGGTTQEQITALKRAALRHVDIRGLDGFNITTLPVDRAREARRQFDAAGIRVAMFGSPLGKVDITDDFAAELAKLDHLGTLSEVLSCNAVRIFSYYNKTKLPHDAWERISLDRLAALRDRAAQLGLVLYHENERHIFGDLVADVLKIAQALRQPATQAPSTFRLIFDFDNYNQSGEDVWAGWLKLRDQTDAFHLKDSDAQHHHVPIGQGTGQVRRILEDAVSRAWHGPVSLEPHLAFSKAVMATGPSGTPNEMYSQMSHADSFHIAAETAKALLGQIKAPIV